jgi:hypothetical protein
MDTVISGRRFEMKDGEHLSDFGLVKKESEESRNKKFLQERLAPVYGDPPTPDYVELVQTFFELPDEDLSWAWLDEDDADCSIHASNGGEIYMVYSQSLDELLAYYDGEFASIKSPKDWDDAVLKLMEEVWKCPGVEVRFAS